MSALSLINQFPLRDYPILAGGANDGAQDVLLTITPPTGFFIGSVTATLAGAGVTSGDVAVLYDGVGVGVSVIGASATNPSATCTFFFESDGASVLSVALVGDGANWTSPATTLFLRQLA